MTKFMEKRPIECECGATFTGFFSTTVDDDGNVLKRERTNNLNGDLCAKCNVKNGGRYGNDR